MVMTTRMPITTLKVVMNWESCLLTGATDIVVSW
jgi:hypothetical protein